MSESKEVISEFSLSES